MVRDDETMVGRAWNVAGVSVRDVSVVDAWVLGDDIAVSDSSGLNPNNSLRTVYLEPLMAKLDARNPAVASDRKSVV